MREQNKIDEVMLAAFVDDQLDVVNREAVIKAMDKDKDLRDQVYDLRKTKDLMKLGFGDANSPTHPDNFKHALPNQCMARIAAVFATLIIGAVAGFSGYKYCTHVGYVPAHTLAELSQQQGERIIVHISESDPAQFETTLAYTEKFLNEHKNNGKARIEVVANAGGIDLLRAEYPLSGKVMSMMDKHDNLTFIACTNAINKLRAQGIDPSIIDNVGTDEPALIHIIDRLRTGWTYIKADSEALRI